MHLKKSSLLLTSKNKFTKDDLAESLLCFTAFSTNEINNKGGIKTPLKLPSFELNHYGLKVHRFG
ncbi:hypothetical protein H8R25_15345 [Flavobacterium sp. F-392]|uniref:Uncharacterized protein n=1 Tax=Flavobacterium muglaense TaxID=2764716 RepID=A0A923N1W2_9FLAO|nr:hypothetical protein [Flavobacterium muglaense]MBC5845799.1 hypothetical protein [Flavobacterium muglaense]